MIEPAMSLCFGNRKAWVLMVVMFLPAHFISQCFSASFGSINSWITSRADSGTLLMYSSNFLRVAGLLYFADGLARITNRFDARNGMALTALFNSSSLMVRASR